MNEKNRKRREWVKTAAIVFLSVMLVLTFFSNTIMNYSLPEVAAQYAQSGTITAKIRGNGVVESSDPYNVMIKQTRKVMSVAVKSGEQVQKGDILVYLEDTESEELKEALETLETAQEAYDIALLAADVNAGIVQDSHSNISNTTYRQQIDAAQAAVKEAENVLKEKQNHLKNVSGRLTQLPSNNADTEDEQEAFDKAKAVKENADFVLQGALNEQKRLKDMLAFTDSVSDGNAQSIQQMQKLTEQKQAADLAVINAQTDANNAQLAYDKANLALKNKTAEGDTASTKASLERQQAKAQQEVEDAKDVLKEKEANLTQLTENINKTLNLESLYKDITDAKELVEEETAKTMDSVVTAEVAGTVLQMNATAGQEVSAAEAVAVIQPEDKGYTMSFTVTNEQAKRLSVGDKAELINAWYYEDMDITLTNIKPNPTNPSQQKLLTFQVAGSVTQGQTLNVSVGQKSADYDCIVPNSAIREDNNGKFVLIVESKSSPLGNRYVATRADVEVLASDDTRSAVKGTLYGYEYVITTSTKPVEAGQLVRLAEN